MQAATCVSTCGNKEKYRSQFKEKHFTLALSFRRLSVNIKIEIYKTIILSVILYGRETWYLKLKEERRLRVFENRV